MGYVLRHTGAQLDAAIEKVQYDYADVSEVNAAAADVRSGKKIVGSDGSVITGTIPNKAAQTYTPGTTDQTIAAGQYIAGAQVITGDTDLVAGNIKSGVSIFGVTGNYAGNAAPETQTKTVTPNAAGQTVTPDSGKLLSAVTINGDADLVAGNIKSGVNIFGVTGSYVGASAPQTQTKTVTPSSQSQTVNPDSGKLLSSVTVDGDADLVPSNIKSGVNIFGVTGNYTGSGSGSGISNLLYNAQFNAVGQVNIDWDSAWDAYDGIFLVPYITFISNGCYLIVGHNDFAYGSQNYDYLAITNQEINNGYSFVGIDHSCLLCVKNGTKWIRMRPRQHSASSSYNPYAPEATIRNLNFMAATITSNTTMSGYIKLYGI